MGRHLSRPRRQHPSTASAAITAIIREQFSFSRGGSMADEHKHGKHDDGEIEKLDIRIEYCVP